MNDEKNTPSGKACIAFADAMDNHSHELDAETRHVDHRERVSDAATRLKDAQWRVYNEGQRLRLS